MTLTVRTTSQPHGHVLLIEATEEELRQAVDAYVAEMNAWLDHMRRVAADEAAGVPQAERHQAFPRPYPDGPLADAVRQCIKIDPENGGTALPDYVIVPPPQPDAAEVFKSKHDKLLRDIGFAEADAHAKVTHPRKARLIAIKEMEASVTPEDYRTEEHKRLIEAANIRRKRHAAINLHAAHLEAELADLTPETIDGWQPKPFPEN